MAVVLACAGVSFLIASCGVRPTPVITGNAAPRGAVTGVVLYFVADGKLRAVVRATAGSYSDDRAVFQQLAAGPTPSERAGGVTSEVPNVTAKFDYPDGGTYVIVDAPQGGLSSLAVDQIVCTVVAARTVTGQTSSPMKITVIDQNKYWSPRACPAQTP